MDESISVAIEQLGGMRIDQLRQRYREIFGEETKTHHRQHLVRRIAWRLQMLAQGDISERARRRALEIAHDADLRTRVPPQWMTGAAKPVRGGREDRRLPAVGTVLMRVYRGRTVTAKVLADGFEYEGRPYHSLSAVAREATGTRWNGLLFFGLTQRKEKRHARR